MSKNLNENIDYSESIKKLRAVLNYSQEDLAKFLGVSFASVNRWENGHHEPTIVAKVRLKDMFKRYNINDNIE